MWKVTTVFTGPQGAPAYSNFFFADTIGMSSANAVLAVKDFWEAVDNYIKNSVTWTVLGDVVVMDVDTGEVTGIVSETEQVGTGDSGADQMPAECQILVRWRTGVFVGGREIRGRTFIPYVTDASSTSGGFVASAARGNILAAAQAMIDDADVSHGIYSRTHHQLELVQTASVWDSYAGLRSRRD